MLKLSEQRLDIPLQTGRALSARATLDRRGLHVRLGARGKGPPFDQLVTLHLSLQSRGQRSRQPGPGLRPVLLWSPSVGLGVGLDRQGQPGLLPLMVLPAAVVQAYECSTLWALGIQLELCCAGGAPGSSLRITVTAGGGPLGVFMLPAALVDHDGGERPEVIGAVSLEPFAVQWKQVDQQLLAAHPSLPPLAIPTLGQVIGELMLATTKTEFWSSICCARSVAGEQWRHAPGHLLAAALSRRLCSAPWDSQGGAPSLRYLVALDWPGKGAGAPPIKRGQPVLLEVLLPGGRGHPPGLCAAAGQSLERLPTRLLHQERRSQDGGWLTFSLRHPVKVLMETLHLACCPVYGSSVELNLGPDRGQLCFEAFARARATKLGLDPLSDAVTRTVDAALREVIGGNLRGWARKELEPNCLSRIAQRLLGMSRRIGKKVEASALAVVVHELLEHFGLTPRDAVLGGAPTPAAALDELWHELAAQAITLAAQAPTKEPSLTTARDVAVRCTAQELISRLEREPGELLSRVRLLFKPAHQHSPDEQAQALRQILEQRYLSASLSAQIQHELLRLVAGEAAGAEPSPAMDPSAFPRWFARWFLASFGPREPSSYLIKRGWFPPHRLVRSSGDQLQANNVPRDALRWMAYSPDLYLTILLRGQTYRQTAEQLGVAVQELLLLANSNTAHAQMARPTRKRVLRYIIEQSPCLYDARVPLEALLVTLLRAHQDNASRWLASQRGPRFQAPHSHELYLSLTRPGRVTEASAKAPARPLLPAALRDHPYLPPAEADLYLQLSAMERFNLASLLGRKLEPNPRVHFVAR